MVVALGRDMEVVQPPRIEEGKEPVPTPCPTSLFCFHKMTRKPELHTYAASTKKLVAFMQCGRQAIDEAAVMLNALVGMRDSDATELFQGVLEFLGEKRREAKEAVEEIASEDYQSRRIDETVYAFDGSEGHCYRELIEKVAHVVQKNPFSNTEVEIPQNPNEKLVVTYIATDELKSKLEERGEVALDPAVVYCHRYFEKHFPLKNTTGSGVEEHARTGYIFLSQLLKVEGKFAEVAKKVVWIYREKGSGATRLRKYSKTENCHYFSSDGSSFKRKVRPAVLVFSPSTSISHWTKEGTSVPAWIEEMAALCERAMHWHPGIPDEELKDLVAKIRYIFAHINPFQRGNIVVGEWLELALYVALGFKDVKHKDKEYSYHGAVATLTFAEFREKYDSYIYLGENAYRKEPKQQECAHQLRRASEIEGHRTTY